MALYPTPHVRPGARRKPHRRAWARSLRALSALPCAMVLSHSALAQTTASGTMIMAAPAPASAPAQIPPAGAIHGVADALPPAPAEPGAHGNMLHLPAHVTIEHPTMPELPVIPPPRHIQVAVYSGPTASTQITPVSVPPQQSSANNPGAAQATANSGATANATAPQAPTPGPTHAANALPSSPGLLPAPRIDPSIGNAPQPPEASGAQSATPAPSSAAFGENGNGSGNGSGQPVPSGNPNDLIRATAAQFLRQQTTGLPGTVTVDVSPISPRGLAPCDALEAFLPPGAQLWGQTSVGVRCVGVKPWTLYLQAHISVNATYFVAGRDIAPGQTIAASDLSPRQGDLTKLPRSVVTDLSQIVGKSSLERVGPGMLLRQDMVRAVVLVQAGQSVRLVVEGPGFTISYEGNAVSNAAAGQAVQVRTPSGQVISGIVKDRETVDVQM